MTGYQPDRTWPHGDADRVVLVAGTRPEFIKLHPLAVALVDQRIPCALVATNQHRTGSMRDAFLDGLSWPCPIDGLDVRSVDTLDLLAEIVSELPKRLRSTDLVVVEGDTTSVLAASLVANKRRLRLSHVEAGLRSYDLRMPEEHNRRICDHIADLLFCPTEYDARHAREEGCPGEVHVVGNTVMDAVRMNVARTSGAAPLAGDYVLVTLHRQENVDDESFLRRVVAFLERIPFAAVFPVHPRTEDRLRASGLWNDIVRLHRVHLVPPMDYLAFLSALRFARVVVTDSGGVQEEATAPEIRRPVVVLRRSTERVPALEAGFSILADPAADDLAARVMDLSWFRPSPSSPFGDGHAAERIAAVLGGIVRAAALSP